MQDYFICDKCGRRMELMWEDSYNKQNGHLVRTKVVRCWPCDNDQEIETTYDENGEVIDVSRHQYFFG